MRYRWVEVKSYPSLIPLQMTNGLGLAYPALALLQVYEVGVWRLLID